MISRSIRYAFVLCIAYIIIVGYLGFFVRDDFFTLTFPSWPFLINCFEGCGYKILIALFANGILVGVLTFVVIGIFLYTFTLIRKTLKRKGNVL